MKEAYAKSFVSEDDIKSQWLIYSVEDAVVTQDDSDAARIIARGLSEKRLGQRRVFETDECLKTKK